MKQEPDEWPFVVETLRDLVGRCGADPLLCAPLVLPSTEFFPDALPPGGRGARRLLRRLMLHAGLRDIAVHLEAHASDAWDGRSPLQFTGLDERGATFDLYGEHTWEDLIGFACFEVALAFRASRQLDASQTPYRGNVDADDDDVWQRAAVTAVYLGFGVLGLDASHRYSAAGEQQGYVAVTRWQHSFAGGLPLHALAWALALQVTLRAAHDPSTSRVLTALRPNQRASYQQALAQLEPERQRLYWELKLPVSEVWPKLRPIDTTPLAEDEADVALAQHEAERAARAKALIRQGGAYRVAHKRGAVMTPLFGVVTLPFVPLFLSFRTDSAAIIWGGTAVGLLGMYLVYRGLGFSYRCSTSDCGHALTRATITCPGCELPILGDVRAGRDELDLPRPEYDDVECEEDAS